MVRDAKAELSARSLCWGCNCSGLGLDHAARGLSPASVGLPAGLVDVRGGTGLHRGDHRCWARIHMGWNPVGSARGLHGPASLCITPGEAVGHFARRGDSHGDDHVVARQRRSGPGSVHGSNRSPSTVLLNWAVPVAPVLLDRKSTRLNSSHYALSRMPSSA